MPDDSGQDDRLVDAVNAYMAAAEAGRAPNRRTFIAEHPEIADELAECLDGLAFVQSAAGGLGRTQDAPGIDPATAKPLGDFRLIHQIGRGGMGVVYEAEQISLGRRVALKVLPLAAALDPRQLQRFRNEALAAAQLHHTNVVPVHAVGCERSTHFYAMQLIDGQSLADVIRELREETTADPNPSSLHTLRSDRRTEFYRAVAQLGAQAADGLEYAHDMGVIHRDIKPGNLMLDHAGTLWIADFGLAQLHTAAANSELTRSGDVLGTLRYMSPEQAGGRATLLDQRTDVYSLGATLFELLTLQPALRGGTQAEMLRDLEDGAPPSARSADPRVPSELDVILGRAMARDVADRYQDAGEFAADLRRYLADEPIKARPPTMVEKLRRWTRRNRAAATAALVVGALATLGLLVTTVLVARANVRVAAAYDAEHQRALEAELAYGRARSAVDLMTEMAATDLADIPQATDERRLLLAEALSYYRDFLADRPDAADADALTQAQQRVTALLTEIEAGASLKRVADLARLLEEPAIRAEIGLTDDTAIRNGTRDAFRLAPQRLRDLTSEQRQAMFEGLARAGQQVIDDALTPDQRQRLREIDLQLQGARAFEDVAIAAQLELRSDQRGAIRRLLDDFHDAWEDLGPGPLGGPDRSLAHAGPPPERRAAELQLHADTLTAALALLTPTQRQRWEQLIGPPFSRERVPSYLGSGMGSVFTERRPAERRPNDRPGERPGNRPDRRR